MFMSNGMHPSWLLILTLNLALPALSQTQTHPHTHPSPSSDLVSCLAAGASLISFFAHLPTPAPELATYFSSAADSQTDICQWIESAPASLSAEASSYSSAISSAVSANEAVIEEVSSCGSAAGWERVGSVTAWLHLTNCAEASGTAIVTTTVGNSESTTVQDTGSNSPTTHKSLVSVDSQTTLFVQTTLPTGTGLTETTSSDQSTATSGQGSTARSQTSGTSSSTVSAATTATRNAGAVEAKPNGGGGGGVLAVVIGLAIIL
ncbi:hypothetical protein BR93DRAFT_961942 [Coniochaeta sp. PMI_546]|nr:hypothetical protein BR93DRAFT_961942 [Coniochaeta sp. PMI_546]